MTHITARHAKLIKALPKLTESYSVSVCACDIRKTIITHTTLHPWTEPGSYLTVYVESVCCFQWMGQWVQASKMNYNMNCPCDNASMSGSVVYNFKNACRDKALSSICTTAGLLVTSSHIMLIHL